MRKAKWPLPVADMDLPAADGFHQRQLAQLLLSGC